jgi:hypothetical protein
MGKIIIRIVCVMGMGVGIFFGEPLISGFSLVGLSFLWETE